jgi:Na+-translocating ferredoxin:NAD+ oxidoreductase RnfG subunit
MIFNIKHIIFIVTLSLGLISFQLPKNLQKKVDKEIKIAFDLEVFSLESVQISETLNAQLKAKISDKNFYKIISDNNLLGYAFVDKAPSKTDQFDYLILFDKDLIIKKAKVLIYREDYGGEIGSKRWLKQFIGKTTNDELIYKKDIIAISGATISANSMTVAVNNLLQTITVLHHNKII